MQRSDPAAQPPPAAPAAAAPPAAAVNLSTVRADPLALSLIPRVVADRYRLVPLERQGDVLTVAMTDPGDVYLIDELARLAGCRVVPVAANPSDIQAAISRLYTQMGPDDFAPPAAEQQPASSGSTRRVPESVVVLGQVTPNADAPAVILLNQILGEAIDQRASDIHIEPFENDLYMRFRIDGILTDWLTVDPDQHAPLISRIKVLSNMDIAEHRLPLDGRFTIQHKNQQRWDIRVSTVPGVFGEKAVLRLLPKDTSGIALEGLGMQERELRLFESLIAKPYGMILVTGPTGAGKTTTLYAVLRRLDCVGKNVLTIEDPVEYELPRVTQMQVHSRIGLTFATGLRHFLRQDPDIMMVGEIRDAETLDMAVQAALTGHLVLSTLHCNDAAAAAPRALDMGLEPFLLTSSVIGVMAQRLVRKVCQNCRTLEPLPPSVRQRFGVTDPRAGYYRGRGCANCRQTGYRGRLGVFEVMVMNDPVKEAVQDRAAAGEIRKIAVQHGMVTLQGDAIRKVQMGLTTPEEVLRAVWMEGD